MSTVKKHLADFHKAMSGHHEFLADHSGHLAECFSGMSKAAAKEDSGMYSKIATHFDAMSKKHHDAAELNSECADACMKAQEDSLNKLVPDSISSVASSDAPFGIAARPVTRSGQPDPEMSKAVAAIPPQFRHLVTTTNSGE